MRHITPYPLWLGHAGDLADISTILSTGIEAVVELADSEAPAKLPRDLIHLRIPLSDGGDNSPVNLKLAVDSVANLMGYRIPTLVACSAGMSRSVAIAAAAIARVEHRPFQEVLGGICMKHPADVATSLVMQLM